MNRLEEIAVKAVAAYANGLFKINDYIEKKTGLSGNLVGISINLCKSIQKELFINDTP